MPDVSVELLRRTSLGALVAWLINDDGSEPVADQVARDRLLAIATRLDQPLTVGDALAQNRLLAILSRLDQTLPVAGVVGLDAGSLAALENVTATVANPTANPETGLAKDATLELVRAQLAAVNANTDALETLLAAVRDEQVRRTDPLPAGNNTIGHVLTTLEARTMYTLLSGSRTVGGSSASLPSGELSRAAVDVQVTAVGGVGPSLRVFVDRMGSDGVWYPVWTPAAMSAVGSLSTTIGQGMTVGQSLAAQVRFRWEISGTTPSFTFSASMVGK